MLDFYFVAQAKIAIGVIKLKIVNLKESFELIDRSWELYFNLSNKSHQLTNVYLEKCEAMRQKIQ